MTLLLPAQFAWAQALLPLKQMLHTRWGTRDGIPVNGVFRIAATPDGYIWLGAQGALLRFDGIRFARIDSLTEPALNGHTAQQHWPRGVNSAGRMLVIRGDDAIVSYRDEQFTVVYQARPSERPIAFIDEDSSHSVWIATGRERRLQRLQDGMLAPAGLPAAVPDTGILGVAADQREGLWIGTRQQGLWHVQGDVARNYNPPCRGDRSLRPLLHSNGYLWITCAELVYFDGKAWHEVRLASGEAIQPTSARQRDGAIWFSTRGSGILRWKDGQLEQFSEQDGLSSAVVHELAIDQQGAVWATTDGGLDRLRPAPFTTIGRRFGLPFTSPTSIVEDADGSIWSASYDRRSVFHIDGGIVRGAPSPMVVREITPALPNPSLEGRSATGGAWIQAQGRLYRYPGTGSGPPRVVALTPPDRVRYMNEDGDGVLWLGGMLGGLYRHDGVRAAPFAVPGDTAPSLGVIGRDVEGRIWLSTRSPAQLTIIAHGKVVRQLDSANGMTNPWIAMTSEAPDTSWGTGRGMLYRAAGNRVTTIDLPELRGMLLTSSYVMIADRGWLWLASEGGLVRMPLAALHRLADGEQVSVPVRWFNELDGIDVAKMPTLTWNSAFRAHDGRLWFSTPAGIAVTDPASITPNTVPPLARIEEVVVNGKAVPRNSLLDIRPNPTRVEIHYTATRLIVPERAVLEYRLDGADHEWVRSGPERMVSYAQLRPKLYTFHVRAWNEDGVASESEATLSFRILPFWYQTWWFLALLLLMVAAGGAAVVYAIQKSRARTENERMQARYDATLSERTRLARELHDTLLQGFTGITLQLQALQRMITTSPRDAAINLSEVLTTADATLRDARQMVWDMRAPELDQHDLAEALEIAARHAIADTGIRLDFTTTGTRRRLDIGIETTALRIGREAVINAVKHAQPAVIAVTASFASAQLMLIIRDDGRGCDDAMVERAVEGGHWGIRGMRERAARAGGTLEITGQAGAGTTITLTVPLSAKG